MTYDLELLETQLLNQKLGLTCNNTQKMDFSPPCFLTRHLKQITESLQN